LETRRRCGWVSQSLATPARVVWARKNASAEECPKSFISTESSLWLEKFLAFRRFGWKHGSEIEAREAEAFLILLNLLEEETRNGTA
jgi:hypothetical protein